MACVRVWCPRGLYPEAMAEEPRGETLEPGSPASPAVGTRGVLGRGLATVAHGPARGLFSPVEPHRGAAASHPCARGLWPPLPCGADSESCRRARLAQGFSAWPPDRRSLEKLTGSSASLLRMAGEGGLHQSVPPIPAQAGSPSGPR